MFSVSLSVSGPRYLLHFHSDEARSFGIILLCRLSITDGLMTRDPMGQWKINTVRSRRQRTSNNPVTPERHWGGRYISALDCIGVRRLASPWKLRPEPTSSLSADWSVTADRLPRGVLPAPPIGGLLVIISKTTLATDFTI